MTTHLDDRAHVAYRSGAGVKRTLISVIDVFRPIRQITNDQLLINGKPAPWTIFDRARCDRHRPEVEAAEQALNNARATKARPYSIAGEIVRFGGTKLKSSLTLFGWVGVALAGAGLGIGTAIRALQPDAVLLEHALRAHQVPPPPTAADERAFLLAMIGVGVGMLIIGVIKVMAWLRPQQTTAE